MTTEKPGSAPELLCGKCGGTGLLLCHWDNLLRPRPEVSGFCADCDAGNEKWQAVLEAAEDAGLSVRVTGAQMRRDRLLLAPSGRG